MELWINLFKRVASIKGQVCQECKDGDTWKSETIQVGQSSSWKTELACNESFIYTFKDNFLYAHHLISKNIYNF